MYSQQDGLQEVIKWGGEGVGGSGRVGVGWWEGRVVGRVRRVGLLRRVGVGRVVGGWG